MIPILYRGDETLFQSNGVGRLPDCLSCEVTEERNGIYELEFTYPVTGRLYDQIKPGMIVACTHDNKHDIQPFDIYSFSAPLDGVVTFYARHISYRLSNVILKPFSASSCADALSKMQTRTYNNNPFTFWTNKSVSGVWKNNVPASCRALLVGQEGSILDVYGKGEYEFDKFQVKLYVNRGDDPGIDIRYGANLTELTQEVDSGDTYTAVVPFWASTDGDVVVTLPEGYVTAGTIPVKQYPWTNETGEYIRDHNGNIIYFNVPQIQPVPLDLSGDFSEQPTVAQLRALAVSRLTNSQAWLPDENIKVSFVDQGGTYDYSFLSSLLPVCLCDRVNVFCSPLGVSAAKIQVIKLVYDVLNDRNKEIELGQPRRTYSETILEQIAQNYVTKDEASNITNAAVDNATAQITGAKDSHIKFVYDNNGGLQELLIMDTEDIETARKVWRWNSGGLGYSSNGYNGPYALAMTQDGSIVADFINTGTLNADLIKAGRIQDGEGKSFWDLITGAMSISGTFNTLSTDEWGNTYEIRLEDGALSIYHNGSLAGGVGFGPNGGGVYGEAFTSLNGIVSNSQGDITGGAWVQVYQDGTIELRGTSIVLGGALDIPMMGFTGTISYIKDIDFNAKTFTRDSIEFFNGMAVTAIP